MAALRLHPDRTSEGICSVKFVNLLCSTGHEVSCLTTEQLTVELSGAVTVPWLLCPTIKMVRTATQRSAWRIINTGVNRIAGSGRLARGTANKLGAGIAFCTGYPPRAWEDINAWRQAIGEFVVAERPDVIVTRSAGIAFDPHLAMLSLKPRIPWVAHYHDPYPISLYPEPYRRRAPLLSRRQEAVHERVLQAADALTFPSERLRDWVLADRLARFRSKAVIVPHVATDVPTCEPDVQGIAASLIRSGHFNLVHTGTLLGPRSPSTLISAFRDFIGDDRDKMARAHLIFIGRVDHRHRDENKWRELQEQGNLIRVDHRISYAEALGVIKLATAAVLLEASATESPFFPAKLADYFWLEKPVLALSPHDSSTADLLGAGYPLRVGQDNPTNITRALELLWLHWRSSTLHQLLPTTTRRLAIGANHAGHAADEAITVACTCANTVASVA